MDSLVPTTKQLYMLVGVGSILTITVVSVGDFNHCAPVLTEG